MNGHDISVACPTDTKLISKAKELFDGEIEIEHTDLEHFCDLGSDYFNTIYAEKIKKRNIQSLEKLGFSVSLS